MKEPKVEIIDAEKGIVKVTPRKKKVAIVGCGTGRDGAPYFDEDWECWGLNEVDQSRADRWFEMHELFASTKEEVEWLKKCKKPIYMTQVCRDIPMSVNYPLYKIFTKFANNNGHYVSYFTCTFAYQIALAIYEGFETIGMFGVNLPYGSPRERLIETACTEYWLGVASGAGIEVRIPLDEYLLHHPYLYGYDYKEEINYTKRKVAAMWGRMNNDLYLKNI